MALKAQVIGYIGSDAIRQIINEHGVVKFSVAHSEYNKKNNTSETIWVSVTAWGVSDAFLPLLLKGALVHVSGELGVYQKQNGSTGLSISTNKIDLLLKPNPDISNKSLTTTDDKYDNYINTLKSKDADKNESCKNEDLPF